MICTSTPISDNFFASFIYFWSVFISRKGTLVEETLAAYSGVGAMPKWMSVEKSSRPEQTVTFQVSRQSLTSF